MKKAYELLEKTTPLDFDCGKICGSRCCKGDGMTGMNLFPHETDIIKNVPGFSVYESDGNISYPVMVCGGSCDRRMRPFGCRIYPLFPLVTLGSRQNPKVTVIHDPRAVKNCPLAGGRLPYRFTSAVRRAAKYLVRDPEILEYLIKTGEELKEIQQLCDILII
ncbi:MAG: hypothetical protein FWF08_01965 [Oscillospiraceae bacterium]|nr:hypothetical protein [Oscillospiraceae bacterium]